MQRKKLSHKPAEPQGKKKPQMLKEIRQQQMHQGGQFQGRRRHQPQVSDDSHWNNYFYLFLIGGACVSVAAVALIYAAQSTEPGQQKIVANPHREPVTGSSRPDGLKVKEQNTRAANSLFKPAESAQPQPIQPSPPVVEALPVISDKPSVVKSDALVNARPKEHGKILPRDTAALFKKIYLLNNGIGKLDDIHQLIKHQGAYVLNAVLDMQNIPARHVISLDDKNFELIDAHNITPLHYSFLTGRMDVFTLLLIEGASIESEFSFSFHSDVDNDTRRNIFKTSLTRILFEFPFHPHILQLCTKAFKHELFIAYLQLKNFDKAVEMMNFRLKKLHQQANKWRLPIELSAANSMFAMLPPVEYIHLSLDHLRESYEEFICNMHFEWAWMNASAHGKREGFASYEPEALNAIQKQISAYTHCFEMLFKNIDKKMSREVYINRRVARLERQYGQYPDMNDKKVDFDSSLLLPSLK